MANNINNIPFFPFKIYVHLVSVHTLLFRSNLNHVFEKFQGQNIHNCHCKLDTKGHTCYIWKGIITILLEVTQNSQWIIISCHFKQSRRKRNNVVS